MKQLKKNSVLDFSLAAPKPSVLAFPGISLTLRYRMAEAANLRHGSNLRESLAKYLHFPDKMTSL